MPTVDKTELARSILDILPLLTRMFDANMRDLMRQIAPPHYMLLRMLQARAMTQSELATIHRVNASTMSATLDALSKRGWISRERSEEDRRVVRIAITDEGRSMITLLNDRMLAGLGELLEPLNEDELAQLSAGMQILARITVSGMQKNQPDADILHGGLPFPPPGMPFPPPGMPFPPPFPFMMTLPPDGMPPMPGFPPFGTPPPYLVTDDDDPPPVPPDN